MAGSALQRGETNFCFFFSRQLQERKRKGKREKGKKALKLAL
jgi:hypothetical protein